MRLSVLVDGESGRADVRAEWGASMYVEAAGRAILMDTGTTGFFADNARAMGLALDRVDLAVLSHGHADHGGGLERFFAENASAPVWAREGLDAPAFLKLGPLKRPVGIDEGLLEHCRDRFRLVRENTVAAPGVHLLTAIPHDYARPKGNDLLWRLEGGSLVRDEFRHELVAAIDDADGLVVLTGCSHHGVLNMVEATRSALPDRPIKALVGGFHFAGLPVGRGFLGDTDDAIRAVAERLAAWGIPRVLTTHCTGRRGFALMREVLGPAIEYLPAGAQVEL